MQKAAALNRIRRRRTRNDCVPRVGLGIFNTSSRMAVLDGRPLLLDYYYVAFRITRVKREWQKSDAGARETSFSFQPLREKPDFYDQRHSHTTNNQRGRQRGQTRCSARHLNISTCDHLAMRDRCEGWSEIRHWRPPGDQHTYSAPPSTPPAASKVVKSSFIYFWPGFV